MPNPDPGPPAPPENRTEIQLLRHAIVAMKQSFITNIDAMMARLERMESQEPDGGQGRIYDWEKEVQDW